MRLKESDISKILAYELTLSQYHFVRGLVYSQAQYPKLTKKQYKGYMNLLKYLEHYGKARHQ